MKNRLLILLAVLTITACQNSDQDTTKQTDLFSTDDIETQVSSIRPNGDTILTIKKNTFIDQDGNQNTIKQTNLFSADDIETQVFSIPPNRDTILTGNAGTILTIQKNTFVDQDGNQVSGEIKVEFKECLDKLEMVLGNMTTTTNGQFLESGGMVYIHATSNSKALAIAKDKSIGVEMPSDSILADMQLYEGVETDKGIDWQKPVPLVENVVDEPANVIDDSLVKAEDIIKRSNVAYRVKGYHYGPSPQGGENVPPELAQKISNLIWAENGLIISQDSTINIDGFEVELVKTDNILESQWVTSSFDGAAIQGQNQFLEDKNTSYVFSVKKLGWANIDRLFTDPRTKEIELIVAVENHGDFDNIYTSMVFPNQSMYLPGYQKKDNTFSFTHGDYEKTSLPVGETTTVLVIAYKKDKPFYAIKTFTIKETQTIALKLSATTKDDLKKELERRI